MMHDLKQEHRQEVYIAICKFILDGIRLIRAASRPIPSASARMSLLLETEELVLRIYSAARSLPLTFRRPDTTAP
jgi:hypothetical protein